MNYPTSSALEVALREDVRHLRVVREELIRERNELKEQLTAVTAQRDALLSQLSNELTNRAGP